MKHFLPSLRQGNLAWRWISILVFLNISFIISSFSQSKIWDKTYGGNGFDLLTAAKPIRDGGYILGGYSYSNSSGDKTEVNKGEEDYWLIKLNADGSKAWDKTFGGN